MSGLNLCSIFIYFLECNFCQTEMMEQTNTQIGCKIGWESKAICGREEESQKQQKKIVYGIK